MKRVVLTILATLAILCFAASLSAWVALSAWVPSQGKARLIHELERRAPVLVTVGAMRYDVFQGFVLTDVQVERRDPRARLCAIPSMQVRVDWMSLLFRRVAFRGRALLQSPGATVVTIAGHTHLADHAYELTLRTEETPVRSLRDPLRPLVPAELREGSLRLELHVTQPIAGRTVLAWRLNGTDLVWADAARRVTGDLAIDGSATPPRPDDARWGVEGRAVLRNATAEGVPSLGRIDRLEGTARFGPERIDLEQISGRALGSRWVVEGTVWRGAPPSCELHATSRADVNALSSLIPALGQSWHLEGPADVATVCRGWLAPSPRLDCLTQAQLRRVGVTGTKLAHPLTEVTGTLAYDALARHLSIHALAGRLAGAPVGADGDATLSSPIELALRVNGALPLEMVTPWLPAGSPVTHLSGQASGQLTFTGPTTALRAVGRIDLHDAAAQVARPALMVERGDGAITLAPDHIEIPHASFLLNQQPLTLRATMTPQAPQQLDATIGFPQGELALKGRLSATNAWIDEGVLSLNRSRLRFTGRLDRTGQQPSLLTLAGTVELSELSQLPFMPREPLASWRLAGPAMIDGKLQGRWTAWEDAAIDGRVRAEHLLVRDIPLEQLLCTITQHDRQLRLNIPTAFAAEGKLWGDLAVQHRARAHNYRWQADIVGLKLARCADLIPAWRTRTVTGTASAHAIVAGTWEDRRTWIGEGWLNAQGQGLGDVPLLDRLFNGLFGLLGDRLQLEALRRAQITQAAVQWQLAKERFWTEDLRLGGLAGTDPMAIYAKGSVGLDQTLDFIIEPELSESALLAAPTTATFASAILKAAGQLDRLRRLIGRHRLTGTLTKPNYRFEVSTNEIFKELSPTTSDLLQDLLNRVR